MPISDIVIFVSNPFGFGPTGKIITVMTALSEKWSGRIVYAASEQCQEPLDPLLRSKIEVITLSERNEDELRVLCQKYPRALIVVSLNRTAARTAKETGHVVFFIDSLTWMWDKIPAEYLLADRYYFYDIFGARNKTSDITHAIPISPILGHLPERSHEATRVLIHIGGFVNPFSNGLARDYLLLLWKSISEFEGELTVAGGSAAIQFLKEQRGKTSNHNIELETFGHSEFIQRVSVSERFITTPGSTATFEALAMGVPVAFLPPTNLSQWRQSNLFKDSGVVSMAVDWEDLLILETDFGAMSEANAVTEFENIAEKVNKDVELRNKAHKLIRKLTTEPIQETLSNNQFTFGNIEGSEVIVSDILKLFASNGK